MAVADGADNPAEPIPPPPARREAARSANGRAVADGDAAGGGTITHSVRLVLVDRGGAIRGYYDATDDAQMKRLIEMKGILAKLNACTCATLEECGRAFIEARSKQPPNWRLQPAPLGAVMKAARLKRGR